MLDGRTQTLGRPQKSTPKSCVSDRCVADGDGAAEHVDGIAHAGSAEHEHVDQVELQAAEANHDRNVRVKAPIAQ